MPLLLGGGTFSQFTSLLSWCCQACPVEFPTFILKKTSITLLLTPWNLKEKVGIKIRPHESIAPITTLLPRSEGNTDRFMAKNFPTFFSWLEITPGKC